MRISFLFLLTFAGKLCYGQDTLYFDKEWKPAAKANAEFFRIDKKEGDKWLRTDYYKQSGQLQMRGSFSSLNPETEDGKFEWYFDNGKPEHKGRYENGNETGEHLYYYDNGNLNAREIYKNGKLNGADEEYYANGQLKEKTAFLNGRQNGWTEHYDDNGKKESEGSYKNGNRNGEWKYYDANEKIASTKVFKTEYVIPEAKIFIQLPNDEWSLKEHTNEGKSKYIFKRNEITDDLGRAVIPSIKVFVENATDYQQDIGAYSEEKITLFEQKGIKLEKKFLSPVDDNFPVSFDNSLLVTATYTDNGVSHICYLCYIITKDNKGIRIYMDSVKDADDKSRKEFLKTLKSIKERVS